METSVLLLKERFGQSYKEIEAHRQALIDLPGPNHTTSSVCQFHDAIENHICSLTELGQSEDTSGGLLTTILLGKIPGKMKQNIARAHGKQEWTITELRTAIRDELHILELRSHSEPNASIPPTASFHSSVSKPTHTKSKIQCLFCKGSHTASMCDQVTDPRKRISIVCQERLRFQLFGAP